MSDESARPPEPGSGLHDVPGFRGLGRVHLLIRVAAVALLLVLTGLTGGMVLERYVVRGSDSGGQAFPYLETVADVLDRSFYYRPTSPEAKATQDAEMQEHAIVGALSVLKDPYTRYLGSEQAQTAQEDLEGRYGGVGVDVKIHEEALVVTNVVPESPADEAGLVRMDEILMIEGEAVDLADFDALVRRLRGEIGTDVSLTVWRPSSGAEFSVDLVREEIVVPPLSMRMIEGTSIGWVRITLFGTDTVERLDEAIVTLEAAGAEGIILDLRGNNGGWVDSAQAVIGRFVDADAGPALYEDAVPGAGGEVAMPIIEDEGGAPTNLPVVVLVDAGSASAAEIVAGALQDYDRALLIGETTFGKGSVQRIYTFPDASSLRVTVAEWFTPQMKRIQDAGIVPDIMVSATDASEGGDPVLERAISLVTRDDPAATPEGR